MLLLLPAIASCLDGLYFWTSRLFKLQIHENKQAAVQRDGTVRLSVSEVGSHDTECNIAARSSG
jgi:hypothetical protein